MTIYFINKLLNIEDRIIFEKKIKLQCEPSLSKIFYINSGKLNITQIISIAIRCCGKLESQRLMILPVDFQRQAFQLNIAKQNKQIYQEFEATTSRVFDIWRYLFCDHAGSATEKADKDLLELVDVHRKSLQSFGLLDHFSLCEILKEDLLCKGRIFEKLKNLTLVMEEVENFAAVDLRLLEVLCAHFDSKQVFVLNAHRSLDISGIGNLLEDDNVISPQVTFEFTEMNTGNIFQNLYDDSRIFQSKEKETNKRRIEQIFVSYIRLLINTKDEFALAVVLNLPGTDITPKIFAKIRNSAAVKNMPIYQAIMSTVMRHQLGGGKGYKPDKDCPIVQNLKPLSVFIDFMMKLQDLIEEEAEPKKCVLKILSKIRKALRTFSVSLMKAHQLEHAYNVIHDDLKEIMESDWTHMWGDTGEQEKASCALQTLKANSGYNTAMKALQHLCDAEAGKNTHFFVNNYDFKSGCPQKTPSSHLKGSPQVELPSLVHIYKSPATPAIVKHDDFDGKPTSLLNRLNSSTPVDRKPLCDRTKRLRSHLDWIGEEISPASKASPTTPGIMSPIVGPTLMAVGRRDAAEKPVADWKETLEEIDTNIEARCAEEISAPTKKRKRALITDISNLPAEEKCKKADIKSRKQQQEPKAKRKTVKGVKQIKGQQSITKFFS